MSYIHFLYTYIPYLYTPYTYIYTLLYILVYRRDLHGAHVREVRRPKGQQGRPGERGQHCIMYMHMMCI